MIRKKRTTRGWGFYVRWKEGSGDWITMNYFKDSYGLHMNGNEEQQSCIRNVPRKNIRSRWISRYLRSPNL